MTEKDHSAKYTFYYLLSLIALVFTALPVGLIAFEIINRSVLDPLINNYYSSNRDGVLRFSISSILIAAPIYYYSLYLIKKGFKKEEITLNSSVRKWLTYFIILVSSFVILGVFIGIINSFLSGGLSLKLLLQSLSMFLISGTIFAFYFYDIKRSNFDSGKKIQNIFLTISLLLVLTAFISACFFIESPKNARDRKLDGVLLNRISNIEGIVNNYYEKNRELPVDINDIKNFENRFNFDDSIFINPVNGKDIVYNKKDADSFELCADFKTESDKNRTYSKKYFPGYNCLTGELWTTRKSAVPETVLYD